MLGLLCGKALLLIAIICQFAMSVRSAELCASASAFAGWERKMVGRGVIGNAG